MAQIRKSQKNNRKSLRRKTARKTRGGNGSWVGHWDMLGRFVIKDKYGKKVKCKGLKDEEYIKCVNKKQKIYENAAIEAYKKNDPNLYYYLNNKAFNKRMASVARKDMKEVDKKINEDNKLISVFPAITEKNYDNYLNELKGKGEKIPSFRFAKDLMRTSSPKNSTRKHYNTI